MITFQVRVTLGVALLALAAPALAQDDLGATLEARRQALPRSARAFHETWLLPAKGESAPDAQATVFAGRVTVWQRAPRERLEIFPAENGRLGDPIVIVSDGRAYHLVTAVGATPLAQAALARNRLVRLILAGPAGEAGRYRVVDAPQGGVAAVVLRQTLAPDFEPDRAFALRLPSAGGGVMTTGLARFSAAGDPQVTAAAGARGVDRVRTAEGEVAVTPDPAAVAWMEERQVAAGELEAFKREAGLSPYDALPPEMRGAPADSAAAQGGGR
jgi:hypothetical protein